MVISALIFPELGETVTNDGAEIENDFPLGLDRLNFCVFTSALLFTNSNSALEIFAVMSVVDVTFEDDILTKTSCNNDKPIVSLSNW